jgi:hypothetical protein
MPLNQPGAQVHGYVFDTPLFGLKPDWTTGSIGAIGVIEARIERMGYHWSR